MGTPRTDSGTATRRTRRAIRALSVPVIACVVALPWAGHDLRTFATGFSLRVSVAMADPGLVLCDAACSEVCLPAATAPPIESPPIPYTRSFAADAAWNQELRLARFGGLHGP